jgi:hypothetical protein
MLYCPDCLMQRSQIVALEPHALLMGAWLCSCGYHCQEDRPEFHCPLCGTLSELVMNPEQAFCSNDECIAVMFNPSAPRPPDIRAARPIQFDHTPQRDA